MQELEKMKMAELRELAKAAKLTVPFGCKKADLCEMLRQHDKATPKPPQKRDMNMQTVAYYGNVCPHVVCPRCGTGDPKIYRTDRQTGAVIRYHKCCRNFKSRGFA